MPEGVIGSASNTRSRRALTAILRTPDGQVLRSFLAKRIFDIFVSVLLLILTFPLFLGIATLIKIMHPRVPVFVPVEGIGRERKHFKVWKFSTMLPNAHVILESMLEADPTLKAEWQTNVKLRNDPRVLPVIGHVLRTTSMNELPQLWNVLCGDMTLVGPRPITEREEGLYIRYAGKKMLEMRHAQRPGITGLWQATGRNDVTYEERVCMDTQYLVNQTFWYDLKILWWTVRKVISTQGAM